jgi:ketosteroid isomerase-like protein
MKICSAGCTALFLLAVVASAQTTTQVAAPYAAGVTSADNPAIKEIQAIEDKWSTSVNVRDQYGLELVLSPLFVDVSAAGDISTRNQQVAQAINGEDKTIRLDQRVVTVRMLGDVAVANGTYSLRHRAGNAEANDKGIFTHVFQKSHGTWLCINSQRTMLHEDPATASKAKKQSSAELPFHVPLFSKSDKGPQ